MQLPGPPPAAFAAYDLRIERRAEAGTAVFTHAANSLAASAKAAFGYGAWAGNGMAMEAGLDTNGDGTADSTSMVDDQQ